ncbi:hypothetical protein PQI66_09750 [Corynebacterium sp. USCH3]|uniref:hypothetical protein n=1 Tax=Corynebacterium sp. USCH3 TaxID=3024840 RepID=UPI00309F30A7
MARRTMGYTSIRINKRGKPDDIVQLDRLPHRDGSTYDLLELFWGFLQVVTPDSLTDETNKKATTLTDPVKASGRIVEFATETGAYGEKGRVLNNRNRDEHAFGEDDSILVITHGVLVCPDKSKTAILFREISSMRCGAKRVLDVFILSMKSHFPDLVFQVSGITESEAWIEAAKLLEVDMEITKTPSDIADSDRPRKSHHKVTISIAPNDGNRFLDKGIIGTIRNKKEPPRGIVELPEGTEVDNTFITLVKDGRQRKFEIHDTATPLLMKVLSEHDEDAPTASAIRGVALDEAQSLFARLGEDWSEKQQVEKWKSEKLNVRLVGDPPKDV